MRTNTKIRHIGLVVPNLKKSINFWCKKLGFKIYRRLEERGLVTLVTTVRKLQSVIGKEKKQILDIETEVAKKLRYWETT